MYLTGIFKSKVSMRFSSFSLRKKRNCLYYRISHNMDFCQFQLYDVSCKLEVVLRACSNLGSIFSWVILAATGDH